MFATQATICPVACAFSVVMDSIQPKEQQRALPVQQTAILQAKAQPLLLSVFATQPTPQSGPRALFAAPVLTAAAVVCLWRGRVGRSVHLVLSTPRYVRLVHIA